MQFDALVVGGSFAGLSAAMQLARARRSVCVVDAGAPRNRFAAAAHGFFGQDGVAPRTMIDQARAKLLAYPSVQFVAGTAQTAAADANGGFALALDSGQQLRARKLLLATGVQDVLPDIPGLRERWGASVLHCPYCHGYEFGGQALGVLYAVPGSAHHVQLIADWGPTTLFLNGHTDLDAATAAQLQAKGIAIEPAPLQGLEGPLPQLAGVRLTDGRLVPLDALFVAPTQRMGSSLAEQLGCAFDAGPMGPLIRTDASKLSSVPGVYAAGDAAQTAQNATLASADGVMAGVALHQSLVFGT
ncbi:Thioredoxin reductase [Rhodoferax sp. OV413]|uniref:NAD(P)/FAD-dependent oxidoreductase n=1 Tax=Rhodoferax sp. OV413 TaxID=1855285 RepID=UPI0008925665|nr:NAD(P)/FAD-dependent oxidoreductase [Rhodoferax sp. OV413]SDP38805.1 Thioredoxin reductase [Rhodoferax sp. OV413]